MANSAFGEAVEYAWNLSYVSAHSVFQLVANMESRHALTPDERFLVLLWAWTQIADDMPAEVRATLWKEIEQRYEKKASYL